MLHCRKSGHANIIGRAGSPLVCAQFSLNSGSSILQTKEIHRNARKIRKQKQTI